MNRPWLKFFPSDWRADPRLRMCSLAARGLWIDVMAYMHEGQPYGHLTVDGVIPDMHGIASLVARPVKEVRRAIAELEKRKVFSRTPEGVIYSRRMVRDFERSEEGRMHAAKAFSKSDPVGSPSGSPSAPDSTARTQSPDKKVEKSLFDLGEGQKGGASHEQRRPPKHGQVSRKFGTIFIRDGTPEWADYCADFKNAHGMNPIPNRDGGYWFWHTGEENRIWQKARRRA